MIALTEIVFLIAFLLISYWRDEKLLYEVTGLVLLIFGLGFVGSSVYFGIGIAVFGGFTAVRGFRLKKASK
jgi:hypothetical protein